MFYRFSNTDILAEERQLSQDLVQSSKKQQEFRSIFQHVQVAQSQKSPSELFAQHIVAIVHQVKGESRLPKCPNFYMVSCKFLNKEKKASTFQNHNF